LGDIPQIPGLLRAIFRLIEAHRNEIQPQRASFAANRLACSARGSGTRSFASFQAHLCLRRLSHLTPPLSCRSGRRLQPGDERQDFSGECGLKRPTKESSPQNPSARTNARVTKEAEQDNHEALRRFLNG
jgi:hypothetical protein